MLLGGLIVATELISKRSTTIELESPITELALGVVRYAGTHLTYGRRKFTPNTIDRRSRSNLESCLRGPGRRKVDFCTTPRHLLLI